MIRLLVSLTLAAVVGATSGAVAKDAGPPRPESPADVVRMSPYEVSANSVDFQHWLKFGSPHFIVYTDASPEDAARIVGEFEMMHLAEVKYFRQPSFQRSPTIVVLPTSRSDWRKIEASAAVEWHVASSQPTQRIEEMIVVQYDWQSWIPGADLVYGAVGAAGQHGMKIDGPLWFGYGMMEFFQTVKFTSDTVVMGKQTARGRTMWMSGWLPWPDFFKATRSSPEYTKSDGMRKFSGQSATFVHYLLTHPDPVWRDRLMQWAALLQAGREPTEDAFKGVFGQDWQQWSTTMRNHTHDHRDHLATIRLTADELSFPRTKLDLPVREMRELFVLAQILNQKIPASETALDILLAKGLKTESLRELLAEACLKWKHQDAAEEQLQTLIAAGSTNPGVYTTAAENLFRSHVPVPKIHAELGDKAGEIRAWCRKALEIEPLHPEAGLILAWTEALGSNGEPESVPRIETIAHTLKGPAAKQEATSALAVAQWRAGNLAAAQTLAQGVRESPYAGKLAKDIAESLLAELGPPP